VCAEDAPPAPSVAEAIANEVRTVFEKCRKAVVRIQALDTHGMLYGTGFFIDPNGTLVTLYTVGGESRDILVCDDTRRLPARRLVGDPRSGIAILKVEAETPFLPVGKSRQLALAAPVVTIGYPMDLPVSPGFGTVAGFDIKYGGRYFAAAHIRANVPVQRGQGGAPLLNLQGDVVGILISSLDAGSAAFALPIEAAEKVRRDYLRFGAIRPGWLGIAVNAAAEPVAGSTARIDEIFSGEPGAAGGLKKDDVIIQIGDHPIASPDDVRNAAFYTTAEDEITIKAIRGSEEILANLCATDPPSAPAAQRPQRFPAITTSVPRALPTPAPLLNDR
jgi:S1-C subfamily serine protease